MLPVSIDDEESDDPEHPEIETRPMQNIQDKIIPFFIVVGLTIQFKFNGSDSGNIPRFETGFPPPIKSKQAFSRE
jgi:hypothetical protein